MPVSPNDVYELTVPSEDTVRVLDVLDNKTVIVISLLKKDTLPYECTLDDLEEALEDGKAVLSKDYPVAFFSNPTENQQAAAERNWKIIGAFVQDIPDCYDKKVRSRFIASKSRETGLQRKQIQRLLYRYWAGGMSIHALYPQYEKRGGPGKPRSSEKMLGCPLKYETNNQRLAIRETELEYIREAITKYYTKHTKYSYRYAYRQMIKEHYTNPDTGLLFEAYPTENQFRYHAGQFVDEKKRAGYVKYNKDMRGILGSSRQKADGPGAVYQIDATVADIYLVSHTDPYAVVGRPELYFVTDVFSRMIVGFYACLSSASWDNARSALLNAFTDKVDFCRTYGIHISSEDWPCVGLPRALVVDNGELISKASNAIISELGVTVKNEPAWRPDLKGIVESRFRLLNISTKAALPGAVLPDAAQRGAPDYKLDALLNLSQFIKIVIHFVLNHNRRQMEQHPQPLPDVVANHVPAIPLELWKWGIANRSGRLRQMERESLEIALSIRDRAQVTPKGIKFHNLYYQCKTALDENWFAQARIKRGWKIDIAYHPGEMKKIYWISDSHTYEECIRTRDRSEIYSIESLEEILWLQNRQKVQKAVYSDLSLQSEVDSAREIEGIIREAESNRKVVPFDTAKMKAKPNEIRKNRKEENKRFQKLKTDEKISPEQAEPREVSDQMPKSSYGYSDFFAQLADEDDDEC